MISQRFYYLFNNYKQFSWCSPSNYIHKRCIFSRISELNQEINSNDCKTIKGWIKNIRKLKSVVFVDVNDGTTPTSLQVVVNKTDFPKTASFGSSVIVSGHIGVNDSKRLELVAKNLEIVGTCDIEEFPFRPKKSYSNEYIRQYLHHRFRTNRFASLVRVRHQANSSLHNFFNQNGYINIHTPVLTSNDCEGAGEVFNVLPGNEHVLKSMGSSKLPNDEIFFDDKVYLTVSGQLHLEAATRGMGNVYTFGPIFRAENSKSRLHLSEFYMAEAERCFTSSVDDITSLCEELIKYMTADILNKTAEDVYLCRKLFSESENDQLEPLENLIAHKFTVMSYNEASEIILKNLEQFKSSFTRNGAFTKEQELFLVKYNSFKPIFIVEWPAELKPFYMKKVPGDDLKVAAFDLLCPIVGELCGGSIREDDYSKLESELIDRKLDKRLKWYLDLRKYGNVPTGGFGLGFERYLQILLNINNIKDTIPFPRWPHNCKM